RPRRRDRPDPAPPARQARRISPDGPRSLESLSGAALAPGAAARGPGLPFEPRPAGALLMIYLSGHVSPELAQQHDRLGLMLTPRMGQRPLPGMPWAVDTGCFKHPESFDSGRYFTWLELLCAPAGARDSLLFVTAPDRLADATAPLERSAALPPHIW